MKHTKIALIGNMNNNLFTLCRYLRDLNFDAHLFIFPMDPAHFQPQSDSYTEEFKTFVHYLKWGAPFDLLTTNPKSILNDIGSYQFYIGCGTAPAYLYKAGIKIDLFVPYGGDIYDLPFFKIVRPSKLINYVVFNYFQKKGIQHAKNLTLADNTELFEKPLNRLNFKGNRYYFGIPFVYTKIYEPLEIKKYYNTSKYYSRFRKIREEHDFIIFHNSRHCWKNQPDPFSLKDNHKLLEAFSEFKIKNKDKKIALVTFEYGHDVNASKMLCKTLNIEKSVFWFPLMERKELMIGMSLSDIVAGEFKISWFTYGVIFEAMALGKPVMHFRNDSLYKDMELYPMINARSANDILENLEKYYDNKEQLSHIGLGAKSWFEKQIINKSLREIQSLIESN